MCGRFALTATPGEVEELFEIAGLDPFPPRYNIAPTQPVTIVRTLAGSRDGILVRWGLVPHWVKDPAAFTLLINARSESAAEKPAFRAAMRHRRCLIPANGFYEWQRDGDRKQPFWVAPPDGSMVAFAGLWETWMSKDGSEIDSAAILTTNANTSLAPIHHRMPVVIEPSDFARWLDPVAEPRHVADLLHAPDDDRMAAIPVSDRVNAARNDGPDLQTRHQIDHTITPPAPEKAGGTKPPRKKSGKDGSDDQMSLF